MPNRHKRIGNTEEPLLSRYEETRARLQKIWDAGYKVVSIRECEFRKLLCVNPYSIHIQDALYGSITNDSKNYYIVKQGEEFRYVDAISLYP